MRERMHTRTHPTNTNTHTHTHTHTQIPTHACIHHRYIIYLSLLTPCQTPLFHSTINIAATAKTSRTPTTILTMIQIFTVIKLKYHLLQYTDIGRTAIHTKVSNGEDNFIIKCLLYRHTCIYFNEHNMYIRVLLIFTVVHPK